MTLQWMGVILVIVGCGGFGFSMAAGYKREISMLRQLIRILNDMEWELQYRLTPLPELCRQSIGGTTGILREIFLQLSRNLREMTHPDANSCMQAVITGTRLPANIRKHLRNLGYSLGRYDLQGQILGLRSVKAACRQELEELERNKSERTRGYQTLALCAGAAIAILII